MRSQQAATLEAVTAGRTRAFQSAETAAAAAESLTGRSGRQPRRRRRRHDGGSPQARCRACQRRPSGQAVSEAKAQRSALVDQLASLKNTTVALESARVDALDRQRQQERLAALTAAAARARHRTGHRLSSLPLHHRDRG